MVHEVVAPLREHAHALLGPILASGDVESYVAVLGAWGRESEPAIPEPIGLLDSAQAARCCQALGRIGPVAPEAMAATEVLRQLAFGRRRRGGPAAPRRRPDRRTPAHRSARTWPIRDDDALIAEASRARQAIRGQRVQR